MKRGVTIIELIIVTAVVSILLLIVLDYLTDRTVDNAIRSARTDLQLETQLTLDNINDNIKHAASVDEHNRWPDNHAPESPTDLLSWESDDDTLILARPSQDSDNNLMFEDPQGYITHKDNLVYFLDDGNLYLRTLASTASGNKAVTSCPVGNTEPDCPADIRLAEGVTDFSIIYYDANETVVAPDLARSVGITLALSREIYGQTVNAEYSIIRTVFRNE